MQLHSRYLVFKLLILPLLVAALVVSFLKDGWVSTNVWLAQSCIVYHVISTYVLYARLKTQSESNNKILND